MPSHMKLQLPSCARRVMRKESVCFPALSFRLPSGVQVTAFDTPHAGAPGGVAGASRQPSPSKRNSTGEECGRFCAIRAAKKSYSPVRET